MLRKWLESIARRRQPQGAGSEHVNAPVAAAPAPGAQEWLARGNAALGEGRIAEAADCYGQAIALDPGHASARLNRGYARLELGQVAQALTDLDAAAMLDRTMADVPYLQAQALARLGQPDEAVAALRRAVAARPDFAHAWRDLVGLQDSLQRTEDALRDADAALRAVPGDLALLEWRGKLLSEAGRHDEALAVAQQLVQAESGSAQRWVNLGVVLYRLERYEQARDACRRAVALPGANASAWYNLGCCHVAFNDCEAVLNAAAGGLKLEADNADLRWLQATAWLLQGKMDLGWPAYEARWHRSEAVVPTRPDTDRPEWDGTQPLAGRTLLVYAEQAFGDTIQFLRFVRPLQERGARVLLRLQPALLALARGLVPGGAELLAEHDPLPPFDLHVSLMSLPWRLGITLETLSPQPYLRADPELRAQWEARLGPRSRPRLALVWSGKPLPDPHRSVPLAQLLEAVPDGFQLVSLQNDIRDDDRAALAGRPDLLHVGAALRSFADTAALADCTDYVVTIDTGPAHLVGALGKPMTVLLPYVPDWRWMLEREDSPWYARARLLRQDASREWGPVLRRLREQLQSLQS